jgi:hypothetical protein
MNRLEGEDAENGGAVKLNRAELIGTRLCIWVFTDNERIPETEGTALQLPICKELPCRCFNH